MSQYFQNIGTTFSTLLSGLKLTLRHLINARKARGPVGIAEKSYFDQPADGLMTLQYPHEMIPVPDNGRYRLHTEIDDCIVCDKCAKICPVDCIDIEPVRAVDTFGNTSDGTPKRIYAAKFDIDMGKCCFCGLCTTVCPTECLTMTKTFDFSEEDVNDHTYAFAEMDLVEIARKKKEFEEYQQQKQEGQAKGESTTSKPVVRPRPAEPKPAAQPKNTSSKPVFKPKVSPKSASKPKFVPRPMTKKKPKDDGDDSKG